MINAGYTVELAGGGQHTPALFRQRISGISAATKPGEGIHVNLLYLNPFLWNMQFPLCIDLKRNEGFNIECITIAAGVPGLDKCAEICEQMLAVGITKLGFKPGTAGAIASVVAIAHANPKMHIILQWTGGRSGGHHSMEDSHYPLLQTYSLIRTAPNIVLVFGGGIGDAASSLPYLSGAWSLPHFKPPMPVDGLLYGSRLMVALEAPTAPEVKALIVKTPGVTNEKEWEQSSCCSVASHAPEANDLREANGSCRRRSSSHRDRSLQRHNRRTCSRTQPRNLGGDRSISCVSTGSDLHRVSRSSGELSASRADCSANWIPREESAGADDHNEDQARKRKRRCRRICMLVWPIWPPHQRGSGAEVFDSDAELVWPIWLLRRATGMIPL